MKPGALYLLVAIAAGAGGYYLFQQHFTAGQEQSIPSGQTTGIPASLTGAMRPDFRLPDLQGRLHGPGQWSGKVLILNFWASWCPPCLQEIPAFIRLQDKYASQGIQFVGIALEEASAVQEFVAAQGINYPVLAGEEAVISVAENYGNHIGTLPYTVFIDREQRIAYIERTPLSEQKTEQMIISLIKPQ